MRRFERHGVNLAKFVVLTLVFLALYVVIREWIKILALGALDLNITQANVVRSWEPWLVTFYFLTVSIISCRYIRSVKREQVYNEINSKRYPDEARKLKSEVHNIVFELTSRRVSLFEIADRQSKTVYAITGNWRSGKTTTAGHLIDILRKEQKITIGGEYYHDTFNFGNINESIHAFFGNLARLTGAHDFKKLAFTATPQNEVGLSLGPLKLDHFFTSVQDVGALRKSLQDTLNKQNKVYVLVIDDIDRLLFSEQLQWLRTVELLGKFSRNLLLIVPINYTQVERGLASNNISEKYLEKILPQVINVGVDVDFIRKTFGITGKSSVGVKRRYAKYMFCLSMRACINRMSNDADNSSRTLATWKYDFLSGAISQTALRFTDNLQQVTDENMKMRLGESGYTVEAKSDYIFNNDHTYSPDSSMLGSSQHQIISTANNAFLDTSWGSGKNFLTAKESSLDRMLDIHRLQAIFERVLFKKIKRTGHANFAGIEGDGTPFWETIGFGIVKGIKSDPSVSMYFTYDMILEEAAKLLSAQNEAEETQILIDLVRSGKSAQ